MTDLEKEKKLENDHPAPTGLCIMHPTTPSKELRQLLGLLRTKISPESPHGTTLLQKNWGAGWVEMGSRAWRKTGGRGGDLG